MSLSQMDLRALSRDPAPQVRAELAGKVAQSLQSQSLRLFEIDIAVDILRMLARDLEVQVRRAVALSLCHSGTAPHDVMLRLAEDVADVAMPVLQFSKLLTDEELIQIAEHAEEVLKLVAIAKREQVSAVVSSALVNSCDEKVIHVLFKNPGATIDDATLEREWAYLSSRPLLLETLVHRSGLSVAIAEKLYASVATELKAYLASAYHLPSLLVEEAVEDHREEATLRLAQVAAEGQGDVGVESLVHQLFTSGRLTHSIIMRALCRGEFDFFEAAMSRLAGVPRANAHILIYDSGTLGFKAFYEKAKLPSAFYDAAYTILRMGLALNAAGTMSTSEFQSRLVARIQMEGLDYSVENMHYLLSIVISNLGESAPKKH